MSIKIKKNSKDRKNSRSIAHYSAYHRFYIVYAVALAVALADQASKYFLSSLSSPVKITDFLYINSVTNTGAAFGIFQGANMLIALLSVLVIAVVSYYINKLGNSALPFAGMLLGGVIGNLIDRLALGHVFDFIDFTFWPAFNVADIGITLGAIGLVWFMWKQ